tara:strand:+ start:861 stop:1028 length:168 start_codon:yes stop_codon:yes gene_type:complete
MKTFKQFIDEMPNAGPSSPVSMSGGKLMPNFGAGRIGKIKLKNGKPLQGLDIPKV